MVDLAGSERVSKTHSTGAILREAMYINKSLSFLEQCVIALTDRGRDHVPFRQSKLTHYLKDSLGGNCKTTMIANIWGEAAQLDETISTLSFATRMMHVRNEAQVNIKMDASLLVKKYEQEIRELKQELAMHDALSGRNRVKYEPYTDEQRYELSQSIQRFLKGEVEELEIVNVRHVKELFSQFKIICNNALDEAAAGRRPNSVMPAGADGAAAAGGEAGAGAADGVGQLADRDGFSIGRAADSAKPLQSVKKGGERAPPGGASPVPNRGGAGKAVGAGLPPPDKKQAFEDFKETDGGAANARLRDTLKTLRDKRKQQQDLVLVINGCKREIDALKEQLDGKREQVVHAAEERGAELVIDDEEFALVRTLKARKAAYREGFEELKVLKSEVEYLAKLSEQARAALLLDFEAWYTAAYEGGPAPAGGAGGAGPGGAGASLREEDDGEAIDDSEKFDRLEVEKVMAEDPDSLAYHKAAKNVLRKTAPGAKGAAKRVKGEAAPQPVV
jgi:kinesin family protein 6/9